MLSLLGCKTARAGGCVKGGGRMTRIKASIRTRSRPPNGGVQWGLGNLPQQAKHGGVYRRALLASFVRPELAQISPTYQLENNAAYQAAL